LIAVDWGSSSFRAFRMNDDGEILERRSSAAGVLSIEGRHFKEVLFAELADWLEAGETSVFISGMAGSRQGWVETAYLPCPVGLAELANAVVDIPMDGLKVHLIPGVATTDSYGVPDVMRGEETQALGVMDACGGNGLICLPGTHSKWINIADNRITAFITCMTGDLFGALRRSSILSRLMTVDDHIDNATFLRGVARSANSGGLLHHLFSVRTLALMEDLAPSDSASYLSGLLIGHEIRSAMPAEAHVRLVGSPLFTSLYGQAINVCRGTFTIVDSDAAARGLSAIAGRLRCI
jgi:2-dehydro-3-deoxygalactonokinase